ncbi:MAG: hypothetical protein AB1645_02775 [Bacillota bacterium]
MTTAAEPGVRPRFLPRSEAPTALLAGARAAYVFPGAPGRILGPARLVETRGRLPRPADLGPAESSPAWAVSAVDLPRVSIDGRSTLNAAAVRATVDAVLQAGATLAGPLLSEAVAVDLFVHELARQEADILILTQPIAGEKSRILTQALERQALGPRVLSIVYNGPPGYDSPDLRTLKTCTFTTVESIVQGGRSNPGPTLEALGALVRDRLAARLARAGYPGVPCVSQGMAAARAAARLERNLSELLEPLGPDRGRTRTSSGVCLVVADPDRVEVFARSGGRLSVASAAFVGTASTRLLGNGRAGSRGTTAQGWLPDWGALARRLPLDLDLSDLANLIGTLLVEPWTLARGLGEACLGAALLEELLSEVTAGWTAADREAGGPAQARLFIAAGFGFDRLGSAGLAAHALVKGFQPGGVSVVAVDRGGALLVEAGAPDEDPPPGEAAGPPPGRPGTAGPRPGAVTARPEAVAVIVSPLKAVHDWRRATTDPWAIVTVEGEDGASTARRLVPGTVTSLPLAPGRRAVLTVEPCHARLDFGAGPGRTWRGLVTGGMAGIILDGRGRPLTSPDSPSTRVAKERDVLAAFGALGKGDLGP